MKITLSPQFNENGPLTLSKQGDILTIAGIAYDFTQLPDGGTLPKEAIDSQSIASDVERIDGELHLTLLFPHGPNAPEESRFPQPILNPPDGELELPPYDIMEESEEQEEIQ
jgi:hypothetical protein